MRRLVAAGVLVAAAVAAVLLVTSALGSGDGGTKTVAAPATTAAVVPPRPGLRIVFPEGFTREQMAERVTAVAAIARAKRKVRPRITAAAYLRATLSWRTPRWFEPAPKVRPLEGFLFPATYDFDAKTTSAQLAAAQLDAFRREWRGVDLTYARSKNLTGYDVLIIASMVEKEAVLDSERPLIAAVVYNRLHRGMTLGIDATIRYALHVPGTQALTESQLADPTPYNTRLHAGLPPTPIANPGLASLRAAARPARVDYLYFVAKPDKRRHFFTASFDAFNTYKSQHGYGP